MLRTIFLNPVMANYHRFEGLTSAQVEESRSKYGSNILTPQAKESLWIQFFKKFGDPLIIVLLVAGALSIGISCYEYFGLERDFSVFFEPIGIFIAILLATGLSFIFEAKAEREFSILNRVNDDQPVQVLRDGNVSQVPRKDVVVGDVVILNTGEEIPADGQLLEAVMLNVDESTLTGEPMCHKHTDPALFDPDATYPTDAVMRGTKVMEGHGVMRVTAVGDSSEHGKVFHAAGIDDGVKTPLDEQFEGLGRVVTWISYAVAALVVVGRIVMFFIEFPDFQWMDLVAYILQSLMVAVTLIVVAVPEGLPMAVTLALAYSMRRMLRTNNLVRKLHACETMGAATVICTDKTGTLTQNKMQVYSTEFFGFDDKDIICRGMAVNSTAQLHISDQAPEVIGNPTEGALLLWLYGQGVNYLDMRFESKVIAQLPFSTERKYMATSVITPSGDKLLFVKGAPEIVYRMCADKRSIDSDAIDSLLAGYQKQAMRTLGFAVATLAPDEPGIVDGMIEAESLRFVGVVAISDPVREDVPAAVSEVINAGIKVKIVTGDTPGTALEIGRQIGLWDDKVDGKDAVITGTEIGAMNDEELKRRAPKIKIIARARPLDKRRLVEALQANNEVVAVTGDGTNDAPALKAAHVGLSMGDGTSVAKEASDITIIDNSFSSIGRAVMWGRSLYQNIQRFIIFQLTVNVVACLTVLVGAFMGTETPLSVTQMLWVNLIMDTFAAVAFATLPPSRKVMQVPPRSRSAFIISRHMSRFIFGVGGIFFLMLFGLLFYLEHVDLTSLLHVGNCPADDVARLTPYELSIFFTTFVFFQFWNMFNTRSFESGRSAFHFKGCGGFLLIAGAILIGQIAIVTLGGGFFGVVSLNVIDWLIIIASTSIVLWANEICHLFAKSRVACHCD